jgi:signal peptidase II
MSKFIDRAITPLIVLTADQITKILALAYLADKPAPVLPFFRLVLVHNTGISFGMFNHNANGPLILSILSLAIAAYFSVWLWRAANRPLIIAIGAVIGGALGNVIDRARLGWVVDFLDFHWKDWHYPAFNVADSCIVLGIAFIVLDGLLFERQRRESGF